MKKYLVYLDDGMDAYRIAVPAKNEKEAKNYVSGNGEIIAVKDVTEDYPISLAYVQEALKNACFGQTEIDFIIRTLEQTDIAQ